MRKNFLFIVLMLFSVAIIKAQTYAPAEWDYNSTDYISITEGDLLVGINNTGNPDAKAEIRWDNDEAKSGINPTKSKDGLLVKYKRLEKYVGLNTVDDPIYLFKIALRDYTISPVEDHTIMIVKPDGVVQIGEGEINPTSQYASTAKLTVDGTILTKEIVVSTSSSNWADFVFEDDYSLMSLKDLEAYISANNHLPDVPSAEDVEESGVSLGEMDAILLQKIEELTLYIIKLEKDNEELRSMINDLQ
jgi:hypothetical protein